MAYKHLFFDLDHTLWDFETNAFQSLEQVYQSLELKKRGVYDFELFYKKYIAHNNLLWERYRKGLIQSDELRWKRMRYTLLDFKIGDEKLALEMSTQFLNLLPTRNTLFPYTLEILQYLQAKNYALHLITNGFEEVQHNKLHYAGIAHFFTEVITSEGSNSLKPHKEIFDYALHKTGAQVQESIMIGDNLEVDIQGAINAGMDQVFVNHIHETSLLQPTYTVYHLKELENIF